MSERRLITMKKNLFFIFSVLIILTLSSGVLASVWFGDQVFLGPKGLDVSQWDDTDNGIKPDVAGAVLSDNSNWDTCNAGNTRVREYYIDSTTDCSWKYNFFRSPKWQRECTPSVEFQEISCDNTCSTSPVILAGETMAAGYCAPSPSQPSVRCQDTDNGDKPDVAGFVAITSGNIVDRSFDTIQGSQLLEATCDGNELKIVAHTCAGSLRRAQPVSGHSPFTAGICETHLLSCTSVGQPVGSVQSTDARGNPRNSVASCVNAAGVSSQNALRYISYTCNAEGVYKAEFDLNRDNRVNQDDVDLGTGAINIQTIANYIRQNPLNGQQVLSETVDCPGGCVAGECRNRPPEASCTDTDGMNIGTRGTTTAGTYTGTDSCLGPTRVLEYNCIAGLGINANSLPCSAGKTCQNGACI